MFGFDFRMLGDLFHHYGNGTDRVIGNYHNYLTRRLGYLFETQCARGIRIDQFASPKCLELLTYGIDTYRHIVEDDDSWTQLSETRLAAYFTYQPTADIHNDVRLLEKLREEECPESILTYNTPETYVRVSLARIELQFPGGLEGDIGDEDYRHVVLSRDLCFHHNLQALYIGREKQTIVSYRTASAVIAAATIVLAFLTTGNSFLGRISLSDLPLKHIATWSEVFRTPMFAVAVVSIIALTFCLLRLLHVFEVTADRFGAATKPVSMTAAQYAHERQSALIALADSLINDLNEGKEEAVMRGRSLEWAEQGQRLSELLDWVAARIEHNHAFACQSSSLLGMVTPSLSTQSRSRVEGSYFVYMTITGSALVAGFGLTVMSAMSEAGLTWSQAWWGVIALATLGFNFVTKRKQSRALPANMLDDALHSEGFGQLPGPADAQITKKRAILARHDRFRRLYADTRLRPIGRDFIPPAPHQRERAADNAEDGDSES